MSEFEGWNLISASAIAREHEDNSIMPEVMPAPSPLPATIDPEAYYDISLAGPVVYMGRMHSPMHRVIIKGSAWHAFNDAIISAVKLPPGAERQL